MPAGTVLSIPKSCIPSVGLLEGFCKGVGLVRNHHQMNMIGHQAVADQRSCVLFGAFSQQAQIHISICVAVQDKLPGITTLRHVMRNLGGYHPSESCHAL
jgi:hypothetical protein